MRFGRVVAGSPRETLPALPAPVDRRERRGSRPTGYWLERGVYAFLAAPSALLLAMSRCRTFFPPLFFVT